SASGAVYVFRHDGTTWMQEAYIKASNTEAGDRFGVSVALNASGDRLAVGATGEDGDGIDGAENNNNSGESGAVYVFDRGNDGWRQTAYVKRADSTKNASFGGTVSLNAAGDVLAAGATAEGNNDSGAAYTFHENAGVWTQTARF